VIRSWSSIVTPLPTQLQTVGKVLGKVKYQISDADWLSRPNISSESTGTGLELCVKPDVAVYAVMAQAETLSRIYLCIPPGLHCTTTYISFLHHGIDLCYTHVGRTRLATLVVLSVPGLVTLGFKENSKDLETWVSSYQEVETGRTCWKAARGWHCSILWI